MRLPKYGIQRMRNRRNEAQVETSTKFPVKVKEARVALGKCQCHYLRSQMLLEKQVASDNPSITARRYWLQFLDISA